LRESLFQLYFAYLGDKITTKRKTLLRSIIFSSVYLGLSPDSTMPVELSAANVDEADGEDEEVSTPSNEYPLREPDPVGGVVPASRHCHPSMKECC
jgi:hypothetical protein